MKRSIVEDELSLFENVKAALEALPARRQASQGRIAEDLAQLRAEMNDAKTEDRAALLDQYNSRMRLLEQLRAADNDDSIEPASPYFAHMRLREGARERDLFLGKATCLDNGIRIVDWRNAPISRLFYQCRQGDDYEEEMGGRIISGEVIARRTVSIRRGALESVHAPEGVYQRDEMGWRQTANEAPTLAGGGGGALQWHSLDSGQGRQLGTDSKGRTHRVDKRLPDITGLIDPEQFSLVTRKSGFVVIRGSAGSGKTTVALHRIAWLAFNDERINSQRTLFLAFSRALCDYVGHVLPSLGVGKVQVRSYRSWAARLRRRHFPGLPDRHRSDTPAVVVALKSHPAMLRALELHVENTAAPATPAQAIEDWQTVITDAALLSRAVQETVPGSLDDGQIKRATAWCSLRHTELEAWMRQDAELQEQLREENNGGEIPGGELDEEDDSLLLRAWQLRVGPLQTAKKRPLRLLHAAIDEVQDFSPVDVQVVMGCLDRKQSITLAGDTQQHVMKDAGFTSWKEFFRHLGATGTAVDTLKVSYRCTRQVVEFAMGLLGDLREDESPLVTRSGPEVELFRFTDHGACVAFLGEVLQNLLDAEPTASVAVLTANAAVSRLYGEGLERANLSRLHRVTEQDFSFSPGVEVAEIDQVKGLEFDYVVLVEASERYFPDLASARRLLHVGATRAIHQLWLTSVEPPSPIIPSGGGSAEA